MLTKHQSGLAEELKLRGFALVRQLASPETVAALTAAVDRELGGESAIKRSGAGYALRNLTMRVPEVGKFASSASITDLLAEVLSESAFLVRGILFDKNPQANWHVGWHQDTAIAVQRRIDVPGYSGWSIKDGIPHVQPPADVLNQMLTIRMHLDETGEDNGPLEVIPGSHAAGHLDDAGARSWVERNGAVCCTASAGDALLMRPLLLHSSRPARRPDRRRVVHLEFATGQLPGGLQWFQM